MADRPKFEIGLTMAGAISAGAYTAGVIDFIFEALDAIEDVRAQRDTGYLTAGLPGEKLVFDPPHDVSISTMSGTSAGSMVTAIIATILGTRIKPVSSARKVQATTPTGNPLYDAWVQQIHYDKLLSTDDLEGGRNVLSLLNSRELGEIVKRTLSSAAKRDYIRPYVAKKLPIFFCVSNLRGVRYSLELDVAKDVVNEYQMSMHADWMGFDWSVDGAVDAGLVPVSPGGAPEAWKLLGEAALASGAFPVGLAARTLARKFEDYERREWFIPGALLPPMRKKDSAGTPVIPADDENSWQSRAGTYRQIRPLDEHDSFPGGDYNFVNVDGGIFDNEPLELARRALARERERNPRDPRIADRSLILIDPFPNVFELNKQFDPQGQSELLPVIKNLFSAMIAQARFKLDELALARDSDIASRRAVMPIRYDANDKPEKYAIACGSLGGFGGFLSKEFRHHDFMLGRRNCQRFLSHHMVLPADAAAGVQNSLFREWTNQATRKEFQVDRNITIDGVTRKVAHLPIIPLLGKLASSQYTQMPPWPAEPYDLKHEELQTAIHARADALKDSLIKQYQPNWMLRTGIAGYWWLNKKNWLDRFILQPIRADLERRGIRFS